MEPATAVKILTIIFEILTFLTILIVALIVFGHFVYSACQFARKLYNLENPHTIRPMSRKFDRSAQIQREAMTILTNPEVMARMFKRKPNWMPKWLWKIVVGLVIVK